MSIELERSIKKMKKMFDKMAYNRISTGDEKKKKVKHLASSSFKNYKDQMAAMLKQANKDFGIEKFEDFSPEIFENIIQKEIDKFKKTGKGASSINTKISAIRAFGIGVDKTNIYRTTKSKSHLLDFNDKYNEKYLEKIREQVKENKVFRSGPRSRVLRANAEQAKKVIENVQKYGYDTPNRRKVVDVASLSLATGARISSCLKMRAADLDFEKKVVAMVNAKGGLTYYVDMRDEDIPLLKKLVEGLKPEQRLFEFHTKDGEIMSAESSRKLVHRYVKDAGEEFSSGDKSFSFHSLRKAFAKRGMEEYIDKIKTKADVEAEVNRLAQRDPKVAVKYERLYKRINAYRIEKNNVTPPPSKKLPLKDVPVKEAIIFFTSIQMGHFRNDIVSSYYSTYNEAVKSKSKH